MTEDDPFFVGYLPAPRAVQFFALSMIATLVFGFAALALTIGRTPADVEAAHYGEDLDIAGVLVAHPYPLVVAPADAAHPQGRAIMLAADGKHGVQEFADALDGRAVEAKGVLVKRGSLDMLILGADDVKGGAPASAPTATPLGRWRISGEICDGKCASGGMAPGAGLSHKACANLCVAGGLPPVLVASGPVEGARYLLLADSAGAPTPDIADLVARPVTLEGAVERLGDMLVFRVDWPKAHAP
ncbi:MAG: hypothetical protein KGM42_02505 [Hyphomicrobiales bacterium]|nr:hypothetical protein [Hyphomicrobiales bacterium]